MAKAKGPQLIWENRIVIGEIQKTAATKWIFEAVTRDGIRYINIREWYARKSDGIWKPSLSGITVPITNPLNKGTVENPEIELLDVIGLFTDMMANGKKIATEMELANAANAVYKEPKES